jgi:hypothetical protein
MGLPGLIEGDFRAAAPLGRAESLNETQVELRLVALFASLLSFSSWLWPMT